jgi:hypothetical protein
MPLRLRKLHHFVNPCVALIAATNGRQADSWTEKRPRGAINEETNPSLVAGWQEQDCSAPARREFAFWSAAASMRA